MGVLFVDDTDVFIMEEGVRSRLDVWGSVQGTLTAWGKLLIAMGGLLKPKKCFYNMVNYDWNVDGTWLYSEWAESSTLFWARTIQGILLNSFL